MTATGAERAQRADLSISQVEQLAAWIDRGLTDRERAAVARLVIRDGPAWTVLADAVTALGRQVDGIRVPNRCARVEPVERVPTARPPLGRGGRR